MPATMEKGDKTPTTESYKITLPADTDSYTINTNRAKFCSLDSLNSITADTLKVEFTTQDEPTATEWNLYTNSGGTNPFAGGNDLVTGIPMTAIKKIRVTRDGSADGDLLMNIGLEF